MALFGDRSGRLVVVLVLVFGLVAAVPPGMLVGAQDGGNSAAAETCQQGGYASLFRSDGSAFETVGDCVSYAAQGGQFERDDDLDGVLDSTDNCPGVANSDQTDTDGDLIGNACDATPNGDQDGDGVDNLSDNCVRSPNADQADADGDLLGDVCDMTPLPLDLSITGGRGVEDGVISGTGFTRGSLLVSLVRVYLPSGIVETYIFGDPRIDGSGSFTTQPAYNFCFARSSAVEITATDIRGVTYTERIALRC